MRHKIPRAKSPQKEVFVRQDGGELKPWPKGRVERKSTGL